MDGNVLKRLVVTLFIVLTINFFIPRIMKADPFLFLSEDESGLSLEYSDEELARYKSYYGLDKSLIVQYVEYMVKSFKGDFGYSIAYNQYVSNMIISRMLWSIGIVLSSIIVSVLLGVSLGILSAWKHFTWLDSILYYWNLLLLQIPHFVVGSLILLLFSTAFYGVLPTSGGSSSFMQIEFSKQVILDLIHHAILPVVTLTFIQMPSYFMTARSSMLTEINKPYVITARAKGIREYIIVIKHCLINAFNPIIVRIFMSIGHIFGSAIIIETIFAYPGIGTLMRDAVFSRDYPLMQGIFFVMAVMVVLFSQLSDMLFNTKV